MGQKNIKELESLQKDLGNDIDKFKNQKIITNNHDVIDIVSQNLANHINEIGTSESTQVNSKRLRQFIIKNIVQPTYIADLKDTLIWRYRWRKIGNFLYILSKFLTIIGAVLAFSETYFRVVYLSFAAGIMTLLAVLILQLGDFANKESKRKTYAANEILRSLNISEVPEIIDDVKDAKNNAKNNGEKNNFSQSLKKNNNQPINNLLNSDKKNIINNNSINDHSQISNNNSKNKKDVNELGDSIINIDNNIDEILEDIKN